MATNPQPDQFHVSDPAVVSRYLKLRSHINDHILAKIEQVGLERFHLAPSRRLASTLTAHVRGGFLRVDGGEIWPIVFLSAVDISAALCTQLKPDWLAGLGTTLNGPQRLKHRLWEDWWGWEKGLSSINPRFYESTPAEQEETLVNYYRDGLEWLAQHGLVTRKETGKWWDPLESTCRHASLSIL